MTRPAAVTRTLDLPVDAAWALVSDPRNRARWVPLSRTAVTGLPLGTGTTVTTLLGPLTDRGAPGLPDRSRVDAFTAPSAGTGVGTAVQTRTGPALLGATRLEVAPAATGEGSTVTWTVDVHLAGPLPAGLTAALLRPVVALGLRVAAGRLVGEVARRVR
ncbi:SRPBCC family protein [Cellulomonas endophytica]|uniref:SRPBCC family protein n=1 Tax=Cellulomonas endophytica TaxID=2494735 RepID=UPI0010115BB3|nr:SRPBCC family protein [Cellulomonas endophytica]